MQKKRRAGIVGRIKAACTFHPLKHALCHACPAMFGQRSTYSSSSPCHCIATIIEAPQSTHWHPHTLCDHQQSHAHLLRDTIGHAACPACLLCRLASGTEPQSLKDVTCMGESVRGLVNIQTKALTRDFGTSHASSKAQGLAKPIWISFTSFQPNLTLYTIATTRLNME